MWWSDNVFDYIQHVTKTTCSSVKHTVITEVITLTLGVSVWLLVDKKLACRFRAGQLSTPSALEILVQILKSIILLSNHIWMEEETKNTITDVSNQISLMWSRNHVVKNFNGRPIRSVYKNAQSDIGRFFSKKEVENVRWHFLLLIVLSGGLIFAQVL